MSSKARCAVLELLTTEKSYSESLHTIMEEYHTELRTEQFKLKPILPECDIDTIFGNVEDLVVISDDLCDKLQERVDNAGNDEAPRVGDVMCSISPFLKLFQKYVIHFESAAQRLAECRDKSQQFHAFLEAKSARGVMPLESLLIMPVQRIPRYKLLLEEITKLKSEDDIDQQDLKVALRKVKSQADECNEATRRRENIQKLRAIQRRFKGLDLADPSRRFIREGRLCRVRTDAPANYVFYLFDDALIYAEILEIGKVGIDFLGSQKLKRKFDIGIGGARKINVGKANEGGQLIKVVDRPDDNTYKNAWEILGSKKSFVVYADNAQDKAGWLSDLQAVLDDQKKQLDDQKKQQSLTELAAPVGRRDVKCRVCGSQFKLHIRKVQCSKCSEASCNKCSLDVHRNGLGYQIESFHFGKCKVVEVHNDHVLEWMKKRIGQAEAVGEKVDKVRVCHKCLYGREYNRKNEHAYLSWIKANEMYESEEYKNFKRQPDKQRVIDDYAAGREQSAVNGVQIEAAAGSGGPSTTASVMLGAISDHYKRCGSCKKFVKQCQCRGTRAAEFGAFNNGVAQAGLRYAGGNDAANAKAGQLNDSSSDSETDPTTDTPSVGDSESTPILASEIIAPARDVAFLPEGVLRVVRVWAEFAAVEHVQLSLTTDDVIHVMYEANEDGWGYGQNAQSGLEGYFPMSHVNEIEASLPQHLSPAAAVTCGAQTFAEGATRSYSEQAVAGAHRCTVHPDSLTRDRDCYALAEDARAQQHTEDKINEAKLRIAEAQRLHEQDLQRRSPQGDGAAPMGANSAGGTTKNFLHWMTGKAPQNPPGPVSNPAPLDIKHVGAGVELAGVAQAAAQVQLSRELSAASCAASADSPPPRSPLPRPPAPAVAEWVCGMCTLRNSSSVEVCAECGCARAGPRGSGEPQRVLAEQQTAAQGGNPGSLPPSDASQRMAPRAAQQNAVVHPPAVVMPQAPSPPKGDNADSPGVRALQMAGSPKGGEDKVRNSMEHNIAELLGSPSGSSGGGGGGGRDASTGNWVLFSSSSWDFGGLAAGLAASSKPAQGGTLASTNQTRTAAPARLSDLGLAAPVAKASTPVAPATAAARQKPPPPPKETPKKPSAPPPSCPPAVSGSVPPTKPRVPPPPPPPAKPNKPPPPPPPPRP